jgi:hypothetical protein
MNWIMSSMAVMAGIFVLSAVFVWKVKEEKGCPVPDAFDFRRYKALELSRRGLFDKTRRP